MSVVKEKVFRTSCCFIVEAHFCASNYFFVCSVIFWMKMTRLRLGISAKVLVLVSRLHPKNLISKAYANYTKTDKAEGLVVVSEGPTLICQEEKVIIVFRHPPKGELTEDFECWAIHHFAHVTEEGNQEDVFASLNDGGSMTEFRQPLQVQSHLEMPRILVQLGHTQRTWKLAPQTDPKWSPTWSLRRF